MLLLLPLALLAGPTCRAQSEFPHLMYNLPSPDRGRRTSGDDGEAVSTLLMPSLLILFVQDAGQSETRSRGKSRISMPFWVTRTSLRMSRAMAFWLPCSMPWLCPPLVAYLLESLEHSRISHPQLYPVFSLPLLLQPDLSYPTRLGKE